MSFYGAGVEYALHLLLELSNAPDNARPSARDLADFLGLPVAYVRKIMTRLERAGLVAGAEGIGGGWRLARPPEAITVLAVAEAIEGRRPLFECREIRANCVLFEGRPPKQAVSGVCSIHAVMLEAERRMRETLAGRTLADIQRRVRTVRSREAEATAQRWFADRAAARKR